jgi:hypothetical protein
MFGTIINTLGGGMGLPSLEGSQITVLPHVQRHEVMLIEARIPRTRGPYSMRGCSSLAGSRARGGQAVVE